MKTSHLGYVGIAAVSLLTACGGNAANAANAAASSGTGGVSSTLASSSSTVSSSAAGGARAGAGGGSTSGSGMAGGIPYPATHPAVPTVVSGGTVMTQPKIVSISFPGDPLETDIDTFVSAISKTTYWGDRVAEYGVAPLTTTARIHETFMPPATMDNAAIQSWLVQAIGAPGSAYPAPDANTLYALYFPPGVTVTASGAGTSCTDFHGFHDSTQLADATPVVYAVISRCDSIPEDPAATGIQYVSAVASHEIIEGITDPLVESNDLGYYEPDDAHIAWAFLGLAELGDMCALIGNAFYTPTDFPYLVQRIYSNKTAPTGHDPCLPAPAGQVYFNSVPVMTDTVSFDDGGFTGSTKGVKIPVGQSKTIDLDLFSEAATPGPWTVAVKEVGGTSLDLSLDKSTGVNGDKLALTIQVNSKNAAYGAEIFIVESTLGAEKNLWVGIVGN